MLNKNDIFRLVRDASGLKQTFVSEKVGISHVALSRFEKGLSTLSTGTLCSIAPYYFLNEDFINSDNVPPFQSGGKLIKFFISHRIGSIPDFSLLQFVINSTPHSTVKYLVPHVAILNAPKYNALDNLVYAIAIKDSKENIFIFRKKSESIVKGAMTVDQIETAIRKIKTGTHTVDTASCIMDKQLFHKIQEWDSLHRKDIGPLFNSDFLVLTDPAEIIYIKEFRRKKEKDNFHPER